MKSGHSLGEPIQSGILNLLFHAGSASGCLVNFMRLPHAMSRSQCILSSLTHTSTPTCPFCAHTQICVYSSVCLQLLIECKLNVYGYNLPVE